MTSEQELSKLDLGMSNLMPEELRPDILNQLDEKKTNRG